MSLYYIISFLTPFILGILLIPLIRRIAINAGIFDMASTPEIRKIRMPLGGGLVIFAGFIVVVIALLAFLSLGDDKTAIGILAGAVLIFLIGIYDDIYHMGILSKLLGQIIAALIFVSFVEKIPPVMSPAVFVAFGVAWIVGIQNALDFLDNMDGLCAGVSLSIAIGLGVLFIFKDMPVFAIMSFALAGGALAFLRYNLPPANIFLGYTGSLLFGYALACLAIIHLNTSKSMTSALAPVLIMAYPIFDLAFVTISRISEGRKLYIGGIDHSSHKISFLGLTQKATILIIQSINLLLVLFGLTIFFISESPYQALLIVTLAFILAFIGTHLYRSILYLRFKIYGLLADLASINIAFTIYLLIKYNSLMTQSPLIFTDFLVPVAWINLFWILLYSAGGMYDLPPESRLKSQLVVLYRIILLGVVIFFAATFTPGRGFEASPLSFGVFILILLIINSTVRSFYYLLIGARLSNTAKKLAAVIVSPHGSYISIDVIESFQAKYDIIGYLGMPRTEKIEYLGMTDVLNEILREKKIARVILDLPSDCYESLVPIFSSAFFIETRFLALNPFGDNLRGLKKYGTRNDGIYIVDVRPRRIFARLAKRLLDFFAAAILILILSPVQLIRYLLAGPGKQIRRVSSTGVHGRPIEVDCKIDKHGRPQFRNYQGLLSVLKGDLSLVGTSIMPYDDLTNNPKIKIQGLWRKFLAKPGLYGPANDETDDKKRFDADLLYIEKTSLFFDLKVIIRQILNLRA
jgi:UDP-GlcNAc:undecaprenyl-phosphate/decaprenyl-phosphate GlcNAc-1-phosphate transferase